MQFITLDKEESDLANKIKKIISNPENSATMISNLTLLTRKKNGVKDIGFELSLS